MGGAVADGEEEYDHKKAGQGGSKQATATATAAATARPMATAVRRRMGTEERFDPQHTRRSTAEFDTRDLPGAAAADADDDSPGFEVADPSRTPTTPKPRLTKAVVSGGDSGGGVKKRPPQPRTPTTSKARPSGSTGHGTALSPAVAPRLTPRSTAASPHDATKRGVRPGRQEIRTAGGGG